jgi:large subunit ribosomal protein L24
MARVKKNDTVMILTGKDSGKQGAVLDICPKKGQVMVKGAGILIKHVKARRQGDVSGICHEEGWMDLSNVMPVCSACKSPCRVNARLLENGKKVRICNSCKEII